MCICVVTFSLPLFDFDYLCYSTEIQKKNACCDLYEVIHSEECKFIKAAQYIANI